jgi:replicative DNA helicase
MNESIEKNELEEYLHLSPLEQKELQNTLKTNKHIFISCELKTGFNAIWIYRYADNSVISIASNEDITTLQKALSKIKPSKPFILVFDEKNSTNEYNDFKRILKTTIDDLKQSYRISYMGRLVKSENKTEAIKTEIELASNKDKIEEIKREIESMKAEANVDICFELIENETLAPKISTGFKTLDEKLGGGLRGGMLYGIGAITSLGKTTFALNIAYNIASAGRNIVIFSLEMGKAELILKGISRETYKYCEEQEIAKEKYAKTVLEIIDKKYNETYKTEVLELAKQRYKEYAKHLYIKEGVGDIGTKEIRETLNNFTQITDKPPVVIIDYIQILATPCNKRRTDKQNIDENITELKRISRDYKTPVITISSFNRDSYTTQVNFESFKESGTIEYSTDVLMGLQMKNIDYSSDNNQQNKQNIRDKIKSAKKEYMRKMKVIILKNRMYELGTEVNFIYYTKYDYFKEEVGAFRKEKKKTTNYPF